MLAATGVSLGDNLVALAITAALVAYLVLVLVFPERF
jgi:K+-transporting ATPase KdpF subunit